MPRIFIDLTGDESFWNGEIGVSIVEPDDLSGTDMALAIGDHQIVLTTSQACTLYDVLDTWMNGHPLREVGAVRRRIHEAIREITDERPGIFKKIFGATYTQEAFVHEVEQYLGLKGLRFRIAGDEPMGHRSPRRTPKTERPT